MIKPVILSGGAGTRLWPVSRQSCPKQLIPLVDPAHSMMQATLARVQGTGFSQPLIIANADHRFLIAEQLRAADQSAQILLEPEGRNTAPAIALAIALAEQDDPDATLLVLPSDHVINDVAAFKRSVAEASEAAKAHDVIVTFGIEPHKPETGFGYIQLGKALNGYDTVQHLERFVEKPDLPTAEGYLASGDYVWNAGMFLLQVKTALKAFETHAPDTLNAARKAIALADRDADFLRPDAAAFAKAPSISFDYAIMEKIGNGAVAPCTIGWSDVGSFEGLYEVLGKDGDGNAVIGDVTAQDTSSSLLYSTGPAVAVSGLKDIALIATPDVVLAVPKAQSQNVKHLVDAFKAASRPEATRHLGDDAAE